MKLATHAERRVKTPPAEATERELADGFARGDSQALVRLVELYQSRVVGLAARLLDWSGGAEDVAQDVFLAAYRHRARFRGESTLWTHLAAMTVNRCRSVRRRRWLKERVFRRIGAAAEARGATTSGDDEIHRDEQAKRVRAATAALPASYREVIVLHYLEELPVIAVAEVLGLRRNTVDVRLLRARKLLAAALADLVD
jgi:RNA polymerase sigma-70 factor (ECF subfamily)